MKKTSKLTLTTQYMYLFGVLLLLANMALGFLLLRESSAMVQSLIRKSMVSVTRTAADLMDGDVLGAFTEEDVGSPAYDNVLHELAAFQNNADIQYIYAVRQTGEDQFVFTVDPDPVDPGAFGEEVLLTPGLRQAGTGVSAVDDAPAEDRWGSYYSAFSPVFDSQGRVAGIIGIDFSADWYNQQIWKNTSLVLMISLLFTLVGFTGFLLVNSRVRRRFNAVKEELSTLSDDVDALTAEILSSAGHREWEASHARTQRSEPEEDELQALSHRISAMHREMELYLDYIRAQVNTDALTRVGNTTAYQERQKALEEKMRDGSASFTAVVFDLDGLKHINDYYGHICGDRMIRAAASVIAGRFGRENTYRIGGDEFIAIVEPAENLSERLAELDASSAAYNEANAGQGAVLSISRGHADYISEWDSSFRDVFVRADQQMYTYKERNHRRNSRTMMLA